MSERVEFEAQVYGLEYELDGVLSEAFGRANEKAGEHGVVIDEYHLYDYSDSGSGDLDLRGWYTMSGSYEANRENLLWDIDLAISDGASQYCSEFRVSAYHN